LRVVNKPMESGNVSKRLDETSSSSSFTSPAIASGKTLPDSIGLLTTLKILNASSNKLNSLPESIAFCKALVELHASFNNLTFLPTNFGYGLVNLKILIIGLNEIRFLPTTISELESLRYLDALPESFGELQNLKKLNLDQNPLVIPPMEIVTKGTKAIKGFMIKWRLASIAAEEHKRMLEANDPNQHGWLAWGTNMLNSYLGEVKDEVDEEVIQILEKSCVEIIDKVDLSGHQLEFLPEAFGKLAALTHLNLSNNHLQVLILLFHGLFMFEYVLIMILL
nr:hypothetical protein [Tanacetum cinerariifolium]